MNERKLTALFRRALLGVPASLTAVTIACGGISERTEGERAATGGTAGDPGTTGVSAGYSSAGTAGSANCSGTTTPCGGVRTTSVPSICVADHTNPPTDRECKTICGFQLGSGMCGVVEQSGNTISIKCASGCSVGRRPIGWLDALETPIDLGAHFSNTARLEALSVIAFRQLRGEVARHGAPRRIRAALTRAARDERRHARSTGALARRFGGALQEIGRPTLKQAFTLEDIAIDNVTEGCVRETFGALVANYQAKHATDLHVRAAMRRIARDETRHAATSWQLHRWLDRRLGAQSRSLVRQAMSSAVQRLGAELTSAPPRDATHRAGLPSPEDARRLFEQCRIALWA